MNLIRFNDIISPQEAEYDKKFPNLLLVANRKGSVQMKKSKNNSITLWRIIFAYLIMIYHFDNKYAISQHFDLTPGWYIGVEFFFIVSGYLLYEKFDALSEKCHSGLAYLGYRYKKFYPYYLASFLLCFISSFLIRERASVLEMVRFLSNDYFEVFALQGIGLDDGWSYINNTSWFISIMFICDFLIYHCLIKWKDTFINFAAPLIVIICFSFLYRNMRGIGAAVQTTGFYENWALMRGMADMCLGIFAARLNHAFGCVKNKNALKAVGTLGFLFVIGCSLKYGNSTTDFLYTMILSVSVSTGFLPSESRLYGKKWIHGWSSLTMCMYLVHDMFRTSIFPIYLGIPEKLSLKFVYLLLYLAVVTVFSLIFKAVVGWITKKLGSLAGRLLEISGTP